MCHLPKQYNFEAVDDRMKDRRGAEESRPTMESVCVWEKHKNKRLKVKSSINYQEENDNE